MKSQVRLTLRIMLLQCALYVKSLVHRTPRSIVKVTEQIDDYLECKQN